MSVRLPSFSRATKVVLALGALLVVMALTGVFSPDRSVAVNKERAVLIASDRIDFEPSFTTVRLVRQGFGSQAVWAVSFSIPNEDGDGYAELTTVLVNATDGTIEQVNEGT